MRYRIIVSLSHSTIETISNYSEFDAVVHVGMYVYWGFTIHLVVCANISTGSNLTLKQNNEFEKSGMLLVSIASC